jgi:hypothetical protein
VAKQSLTISSRDSGVVIVTTLVFSNFDPADASATLVVKTRPGPARTRPMDLVGSVASYTVQPNDFVPGYWDAEVQVTKGDITISSEIFTLVVLA